MKKLTFHALCAFSFFALSQSSFAQNPILMNSSSTGGTPPAGTTNSAMVQANNNIGIGTSSAGARLQIYNANPTGAAALVINNGALVQAGYSVGNYIHVQTSGISSPIINLPTRDHFIINTDGKTGVGKGTPIAQLEVKSTASWNPFHVLNNNNASALIVTTTGNVGIGAAAPTVKLEVAGNTNIGSSSTSANLIVYGNTTTNNLQVNTNATIGQQLYIGSPSSSGFLKIQTNAGSYGYANLTEVQYDNTKALAVQKLGSGDKFVVYGNGSVDMKGDLTINNGTLRLSNGSNQYAVGSDGKVRAREVWVDMDVIPDYVFRDGYKLMSLPELELFIKKYSHLPNVKSEKEVLAAGSVSLNEMNVKLLEKIEELTLYILQLKKEIDSLKQN